MVMGAVLRTPGWSVSYGWRRCRHWLPRRLPGWSLPSEVSGQGAGDRPTGVGAASAPAPACTARVSVPPIRTLLTTASAPAMVRN